MKYLAYITDTGKFNGWYDDQIHKVIPEPHIEVSEEDYQSHYQTMTNGKELLVVDGKVTFQDIAPPAITWEEIRAQRNMLLNNSDYTQMPDAELTEEQKAAWIAYRKELRRVPESYDSPDKVIWPTPPA